MSATAPAALQAIKAKGKKVAPALSGSPKPVSSSATPMPSPQDGPRHAPSAAVFPASVAPEASNDAVPVVNITEEMLAEEERCAAESEAKAHEEQERAMQQLQRADATQEQRRLKELEEYLRKANIYVSFLAPRIANPALRGAADAPSSSAAGAAAAEEEADVRGKRRRAPSKRQAKRARGGRAAAEEAGAQAHADPSVPFRPPPNLVGGELRDYQLEGVHWLVSLYENGMNGILADEMGLGKTVQVIAFFAHLRHHHVTGPVLITAPLSTLPNWVSELRKWAPSIPCLLYHGDKHERGRLRRDHLPHGAGEQADSFPIVVTSYEIVMRDRRHLCGYNWKYIVIDEGHRIKNLNCRLIRELKSYTSANRLLLTGTPLQNNLSELWSMLNFLMPDIFDSLELFETWFNFDLKTTAPTTDAGSVQAAAGESDAPLSPSATELPSSSIVRKLHGLLRPFLLRRVKSDVLLQLPPKVEVIVYAGMTQQQRALATVISSGRLTDAMKERSGTSSLSGLQNTVMQLRKCCNHPVLFDEEMGEGGEIVTDERIVTASGKMKVLDALLRGLCAGGHKVLLFSQMTRMLDIVEDYVRMRGWQYCRIDGNVPFAERQTQITDFNGNPDCFLFLLSTRAGGLGINLTAADTVIIYDSDWNPHQDAQAQDRCHRIGQQRNVVVYRLITNNSIEQHMLRKADEKRKLERVVIHRSTFRRSVAAVGMAASSSQMTDEELGGLLRDAVAGRDGDDNVGGVGQRELDMLLDREVLFSDVVPRKGAGYEVVDTGSSSVIDLA